MNISKINKIAEGRQKAADEALKIQGMFAKLDKLCSEQGFENYAGFLTKAAALEGADAGGEPVGASASGGDAAPVRKKRVEVTAELVKKMEEAHKNRGDASNVSLAEALGVGPATLKKYIDNGFKFAPKPRGRKPSQA